MNELDLEWENYFNDVVETNTKQEKKKNDNFIPKCSDIYIYLLEQRRVH